MKATFMRVAGGLLALFGAAVTVVYLFQPWRTCQDDATAAACPMLAVDAAVMVSAFCVGVIGVVAILVGAAIGSRRRSARAVSAPNGQTDS